LDLLPKLAKALAIKIKFSGKAGGAFTLGNPAQQQDDGGWVLTGLLEHTPSQDGVGALTPPTAIGREKGMPPEQPSVAAVAARANQAGRMEVVLEPRAAGDIIEQLGYWKVNHAR